MEKIFSSQYSSPVRVYRPLHANGSGWSGGRAHISNLSSLAETDLSVLLPLVVTGQQSRSRWTRVQTADGPIVLLRFSSTTKCRPSDANILPVIPTMHCVRALSPSPNVTVQTVRGFALRGDSVSVHAGGPRTLTSSPPPTPPSNKPACFVTEQ